VSYAVARSGDRTGARALAATQLDHWRRLLGLSHRDAMRCLWLTLADPLPASNGQLLYSKGLIEASSRAGLVLTVVGLARPEHRRSGADPDGIDWQLAEEEPRAAWQRFLSPYPLITQHRSQDMQRRLAKALAARSWDVIVFDSLCTAWALPMVLRARDGTREHSPLLVYVAHNHEMTVARHLARSARGLRRFQRQLDRLKTIVLERHLLAATDVITSNTPEDRAKFAADSGRNVVLLPPGYDGPRVARRDIDRSVPRRAILVGSLDWPPKRLAVESFLEASAILLADAGVRLQLVGEVELDYLRRLRQRFPSVDFAGGVPDVGPYLRQARLALVPDQLGGFKLKGLDYVFHRLPVLAMRGALPGMPLEDRRSVGLFDSHEDMARGVLSLIDDFAALNAWQERAYAACVNQFDWDRIVRDLMASLEAVDAQPARAAAAAAPSGRASRPARQGAGR
jgi:glycosyltransferase involved in cell wall biosynthesis